MSIVRLDFKIKITLPLERMIFITTVLLISSSIFWYRHWYIASHSAWFVYGVLVFVVRILILIVIDGPIALLIG